MVSASTVIFSIIAVTLAIGIIVLAVLLLRKNKYPIPIKPLVNHLYKFNNCQKHGKLIKSIPVGKDKNLRKILYSSTPTNEFGEQETVYCTTIAHKNFIIDTQNEFVILPKNITDVDPTEPDYKQIQTMINNNRNYSDLAEAGEEARQRLKDTFIDQFDGAVHQEVNKVLNEQLKNKAEEDKKKEEEKKENL